MSPMSIIFAGYDMDSGYVYAKFITGDVVLIDCDKVEDVIAENLYERSTLDYLIYNDPASYAELILEGHPREYLKAVTQYKPLDF